MNRDIEKYAADYSADLSFESILVKYRQNNVLSKIDISQNTRCLEIGIGASPLLNEAISRGYQFKSWTIVEPARQFLKNFNYDHNANIQIVNDFFPCDLGDAKYDIIICSGLLHEVATPTQIIDEAFRRLDKNGIFIADVPNAWSLHRQIAQKMNLIESVYQKSNRNLQLQQHHIFDRSSLRNLFEKSGFSIIDEGGFFLKPLNHEQMNVFDNLGQSFYDALNQVGQIYPELASEIFIKCMRDPNGS